VLKFTMLIAMAAMASPTPCATGASRGGYALRESGPSKVDASPPASWQRGHFAGAPLCKVKGNLSLPQQKRIEAPFYLEADLTYYFDAATGKWAAGPGREIRMRTDRRALRARVDQDGTFEVVVPQATTVTFYRTYDVSAPRAAYEVPPQSVRVPLGCEKKDVRLDVEAVGLITLNGRILDQAAGKPLEAFLVTLEYWPPGVSPRYHPRGQDFDPYEQLGGHPGDQAKASSAKRSSAPPSARLKRPQPRGQGDVRPTRSVTTATSDKEGSFSFVVPRSNESIFFLSVRPPKQFPGAAIWERTHPQSAVQIDDVTAYDGQPYIWKLASRTPLLILEYQTPSDKPLPLPRAEGKTCVRGWLHEIVDPVTMQDRVETSPEGQKVEYDYSKSMHPDGLPCWTLETKTTFQEDGRFHIQHKTRSITTVKHARIQRDSKGRSVQMFFELDKPGRYAVVLHPDDTVYVAVPEDKIIEFNPVQGEAIRKIIHVERRQEAAAEEQ